MKKAVSVIFAVAVMVTASYSFGASIRNSKHDLSSSSSGGITSNTTQVCVFCHTPHNARNGYPLWNRTLGTNTPGSFVLYTSAQMRTKNYTVGAGFTSDSVSLYCMTCHDGGAIGGRIKNPPADVGASPVVVTDGGVDITGDAITNARYNIGTDLTNDHPVNFGMVDTDTAIKNVNLTAMTVGTQALPLYRSTGRGVTMECASCHNVHDPQYKPFLRMSNDGSALCLNCHDK